MRAGDFFYTRPDTIHRMIVAEGEYLLQYVAFLELDADRDAALGDDLEALLGEGRIHRLGDRYHALFAQMSRQSLSSDARQQRAASARMAGLLYDLMVDTPTASGSHPAVEQALEFMRSHVGVAYSLDDLVAELGLDKSYFIRLFKKNVGVPPMKYAMNLKMSAASDLLRTTHRTTRSGRRAPGLRRRVPLRQALQAVERNLTGSLSSMSSGSVSSKSNASARFEVWDQSEQNFVATTRIYGLLAWLGLVKSCPSVDISRSPSI